MVRPFGFIKFSKEIASVHNEYTNNVDQIPQFYNNSALYLVGVDSYSYNMNIILFYW